MGEALLVRRVGNQEIYNPNGKEWCVAVCDGVSPADALYANNIWVCSSNQGIYYSLDGKTWTQSNVTINTTKVLFSQNLWVVPAKYYSVALKN